MTTRIDNDGPAYPFEIENKSTEDIPDIFGGVVRAGTTRIYAGLTLRDAFAMAAMQGMFSDRETILSFANKCQREMLSPDSAMATAAYGMADAMLRARNATQGEPDAS
ncbi:hypothetical protein [Alcaligenes aquatilis]|uniref:hypothetical protein n=1 Tax=Alcaligenes aquatilis TaxID=323284 RepID=UPI003F9051CF